MREIRPVPSSNRPDETPEAASNRQQGPPGSAESREQAQKWPGSEPGIVLRVRKNRHNRYFQLLTGEPSQSYDQSWVWPGSVDNIIRVFEAHAEGMLIRLGDIKAPGKPTPWESVQHVRATWTETDLEITLRDEASGEQVTERWRR